MITVCGDQQHIFQEATEAIFRDGSAEFTVCLHNGHLEIYTGNTRLSVQPRAANMVWILTAKPNDIDEKLIRMIGK